MAGDPEGGESGGWSLGDIGHGALDVVGLIPVVGEPADAANAAWHAAEGQYLEAGLSAISIVPVVGDIIGKGGKLTKKLGGPAARKLVKVLKEMDFAKALAPLRKNKKLAPHIDMMIAALEKWRADLLPCGKTSKQFTAIDPGPLADDLAETFAGGRYREVILDEDIVLKRVGEQGKPLGQFFSQQSTGGVVQARVDRAVLPQWRTGAKSAVDTEFDILVPKGSRVYVGEVGSQGGFYVGGAQQVVVPKPWSISGVKVVGQRPIK